MSEAGLHQPETLSRQERKRRLEHHFASNFDSLAYPLLAEFYFAEGDSKRARKVCAIGLKQHPNHALGLYMLAKLTIREGQLEKTEELLQLALASDSHHVEAAELLVAVQERLKRQGSILEQAYRQLLVANPLSRGARQRLERIEADRNMVLEVTAHLQVEETGEEPPLGAARNSTAAIAPPRKQTATPKKQGDVAPGAPPVRSSTPAKVAAPTEQAHQAAGDELTWEANIKRLGATVSLTGAQQAELEGPTPDSEPESPAEPAAAPEVIPAMLKPPAPPIDVGPTGTGQAKQSVAPATGPMTAERTHGESPYTGDEVADKSTDVKPSMVSGKGAGREDRMAPASVAREPISMESGSLEMGIGADENTAQPGGVRTNQEESQAATEVLESLAIATLETEPEELLAVLDDRAPDELSSTTETFEPGADAEPTTESMDPDQIEDTMTALEEAERNGSRSIWPGEHDLPESDELPGGDPTRRGPEDSLQAAPPVLPADQLGPVPAMEGEDEPASAALALDDNLDPGGGESPASSKSVEEIDTDGTVALPMRGTPFQPGDTELPSSASLAPAESTDVDVTLADQHTRAHPAEAGEAHEDADSDQELRDEVNSETFEQASPDNDVEGETPALEEQTEDGGLDEIRGTPEQESPFQPGDAAAASPTYQSTIAGSDHEDEDIDLMPEGARSPMAGGPTTEDEAELEQALTADSEATDLDGDTPGDDDTTEVGDRENANGDEANETPFQPGEAAAASPAFQSTITSSDHEDEDIDLMPEGARSPVAGGATTGDEAELEQAAAADSETTAIDGDTPGEDDTTEVGDREHADGDEANETPFQPGDTESPSSASLAPAESTDVDVTGADQHTRAHPAEAGEADEDADSDQELRDEVNSETLEQASPDGDVEGETPALEEQTEDGGLDEIRATPEQESPFQPGDETAASSAFQSTITSSDHEDEDIDLMPEGARSPVAGGATTEDEAELEQALTADSETTDIDGDTPGDDDTTEAGDREHANGDEANETPFQPGEAATPTATDQLRREEAAMEGEQDLIEAGQERVLTADKRVSDSKADPLEVADSHALDQDISSGEADGITPGATDDTERDSAITEIPEPAFRPGQDTTPGGEAQLPEQSSASESIDSGQAPESASPDDQSAHNQGMGADDLMTGSESRTPDSEEDHTRPGGDTPSLDATLGTDDAPEPAASSDDATEAVFQPGEATGLPADGLTQETQADITPAATPLQGESYPHDVAPRDQDRGEERDSSATYASDTEKMSGDREALDGETPSEDESSEASGIEVGDDAEGAPAPFQPGTGSSTVARDEVVPGGEGSDTEGADVAAADPFESDGPVDAEHTAGSVSADADGGTVAVQPQKDEPLPGAESGGDATPEPEAVPEDGPGLDGNNDETFQPGKSAVSEGDGLPQGESKEQTSPDELVRAGGGPDAETTLNDDAENDRAVLDRKDLVTGTPADEANLDSGTADPDRGADSEVALDSDDLGAAPFEPGDKSEAAEESPSEVDSSQEAERAGGDDSQEPYRSDIVMLEKAADQEAEDLDKLAHAGGDMPGERFEPTRIKPKAPDDAPETDDETVTTEREADQEEADAERDALQIDPKLATFTLATIYKVQGLYHQALQVLDMLEEKGADPERINAERDSIRKVMTSDTKSE
ncbi:MAG: hypothetical protein IH971_03490 [Candidatus Marinimicrobia bacterium]|nr:hypothetical protein [Candidatus Neomarinimicrobiota bacterium]